MGKKSLVALDTDHIKQYVFATDKLKEIRGASSILDRLNRETMEAIALRIAPGFETIYANGGSGLFLLDSDKAHRFGQDVQQAYRKKSAGGASITYTVQDLPDHIIEQGTNILEADIKDELEMMRLLLREAKAHSDTLLTLPSHPFMRPCDACGVEYAVDKSEDADEQNALYCASCLEKRREDRGVKLSIDDYVDKKKPEHQESPLWRKVIHILHESGYRLPKGTERPSDFNDFRNFGSSKDYIALIYADGNNMGVNTEKQEKLQDLHNFSEEVDDAIYKAVSDAIKTHLPVWEGRNSESGNAEKLFPFDLLLLGGDDVVMVTPASEAMNVACTIAEQFYKHTGNKYTLSIGVVLAPIKYPFGLLQDLAESTLKYAKKEAAKRQRESKFKDTLINFMTVTGSTSLDFNKVYKSLHTRDDKDVSFYATLRPYTVEEMRTLLTFIREGRKKALGRTKLHQVRQAVLKMNLTTSVGDGIAILRNWREKQREFVMQEVYKVGNRYQEAYRNPDKPDTLFPRVTFPWFADGPKTYRTSLLDFVELYDFVAQEGGDDDAEN